MALRKIVVFDNTEGYPTDVVPGTDQFDASSQRISNVADPTAAQDAVTLSYLQTFLQGIAWKNPVRASTTGALPSYTYANGASGVGATLTATTNGALPAQDGVTLVANVTESLADRLLVKDETAGNAPYNGIYYLTQLGDGTHPYILTRATDCDINTEILQAAVFVEEGTSNADTAWVDTTNAPITMGTTNISFVQFSSTVAYTFDQGLLLSGGSVTVELDTTANAQGAGAGGGSSGLEFDVNTASGKLRAAVNATGGLDRSATGLAILLDPHANTSGNNPSDQTAAAGLLNLRSPKVDDNYTAAGTISVADAVNWSTTNNQVEKSLANNDAKAKVIGIAVTAATVGQTLEVVSHGIAPGVLTGATAGTPYYLQSAGGIGTTLPGGSTRTIQVGTAKNATDLWVRIVDYGKKA